MNSIKKQSCLFVLTLVAYSSVQGVQFWDDFDQSFTRHMQAVEQSMHSMLESMKEFSGHIKNDSGASAKAQTFTITESEDEVVISLAVSGLKQEDIKADIRDGIFTLHAKTETMDARVALDSTAVQVRIKQNVAQPSESEDDKQSKMVYASERSFMQTLPAEVIIEGSDSPVSVYFDDATLEIRCAKVKKSAQPVLIQRKTA